MQKYISEARLLLALAIPVILAQIAQTAMGFVDTVMAGGYSATDMAAVAIGTSIWLPAILFGHGLLLALTPVIAQLNGSGRRERIAHQVRQGFWLAGFVSVLIMLVLWNAGYIIRSMENIDPALFTGIVQGTAKLVSIDEKPNFRTHVVELPDHMLDGLETGASVAHNGCCLTVTEINGNHVSFDLMKETLRITNLGDLKVGDWVNVERAAKFSDEIGGHLMSGHIMTTAEVAKILTSENNRQIWFKVQDSQLMKYILYKGFIGIDGISLTVGEVTPTRFCVHLIPETLERTTLGKKKLGARVNIEIDPQTQAVVDTVERVLAARENAMNQPGTEA